MKPLPSHFCYVSEIIEAQQDGQWRHRWHRRNDEFNEGDEMTKDLAHKGNQSPKSSITVFFFNFKTRKMKQWRTCLLPWNRQITAWAICREIIKLQHGPSAMKSWNHRMDRLAWNRQIIAWANCREIVKLQHEPSAMKSSNHRMDRLPWNCQITAWANCRENV